MTRRTQYRPTARQVAKDGLIDLAFVTFGPKAADKMTVLLKTILDPKA